MAEKDKHLLFAHTKSRMAVPDQWGVSLLPEVIWGPRLLRLSCSFALISTRGRSMEDGVGEESMDQAWRR